MKKPPLTESAQVLVLDRRLNLLNMVFVVAIFTGFGSPVMAQATASATSFEAALQRYTDDYIHDPTLVAPLVFGVEVEGEWWHVSAEPISEGAPHSVVLERGAPEQPTFFFSMEGDTLGKLDRGEMSAGTAMSGNRSERLMVVDGTEGFEPGPDGISTIFKVAFHFWMRGNPEIYHFRDLATLPRHGAESGVLYYQPGFRSAFVRIESGQHANEESEDQSNPFPSILVWVGGRSMARIGGNLVELKDGDAVLIPAGVTHEFWNPYDEPFEGFMLAFGEGA